MRTSRIKLQGRVAVYHVMSRINGGQKLLDELSREMMVRMMWKVAGFCGLQIITYAMMANHFHMLVRVPSERPQLSDSELIGRLEGLYGKRAMLTVLAKQALSERGQIEADIREGLLARMGEVSEFMKEFKQRFSIWYNRRTGRFGTLWAERFKSVVVEDAPRALEAVAAYIDLNAVRAGLVSDPKDYRYCGYGAAVGGERRARLGLLSLGRETEWEAAAAAYRLRLFVGAGSAGASGKGVLGKEQIQAVLAQGGQLSLGEVLRLRVRHMSDGVALGTKEFVNEVFALHRDKFSPKRKDGARPIRALAQFGLMTLRDLKVRALG